MARCTMPRGLGRPIQMKFRFSGEARNTYVRPGSAARKITAPPISSGRHGLGFSRKYMEQACATSTSAAKS